MTDATTVDWLAALAADDLTAARRLIFDMREQDPTASSAALCGVALKYPAVFLRLMAREVDYALGATVGPGYADSMLAVAKVVQRRQLTAEQAAEELEAVTMPRCQVSRVQRAINPVLRALRGQG